MVENETTVFDRRCIRHAVLFDLAWHEAKAPLTQADHEEPAASPQPRRSVTRTKALRTERLTPSETSIGTAADLLKAGELVAFPTETVYGLGADATNPIAVAKVFEAKGRPSFNPLIVHVSSIETAKGVRPAYSQDRRFRDHPSHWAGRLH